MAWACMHTWARALQGRRVVCAEAASDTGCCPREKSAMCNGLSQRGARTVLPRAGRLHVNEHNLAVFKLTNAAFLNGHVALCVGYLYRNPPDSQNWCFEIQSEAAQGRTAHDVRGSPLPPCPPLPHRLLARVPTRSLPDRMSTSSRGSCAPTRRHWSPLGRSCRLPRLP